MGFQKTQESHPALHGQCGIRIWLAHGSQAWRKTPNKTHGMFRLRPHDPGFAEWICQRVLIPSARRNVSAIPCEPGLASLDLRALTCESGGDPLFRRCQFQSRKPGCPLRLLLCDDYGRYRDFLPDTTAVVCFAIGIPPSTAPLPGKEPHSRSEKPRLPACCTPTR